MEDNGFTDPFFKGNTRPPTFAGVPTLPLVLVTGGFFIAAVWLFYLVSAYTTVVLVIFYFPIFFWMKSVTKKDDQRLAQMLKRSRMRFRHRAGRQLWGAISYSPIRYKRRK